MMFLMSLLCQQLTALVLQLDVPGSFPVSPHFPVTGSGALQTGVLSVPALLLPSFPLQHSRLKAPAHPPWYHQARGGCHVPPPQRRLLGKGLPWEMLQLCSCPEPFLYYLSVQTSPRWTAAPP